MCAKAPKHITRSLHTSLFRQEPVTYCRPEPTYCRPEPLCVVTDIPKRDSGLFER